jgi:hypothetical protein
MAASTDPRDTGVTSFGVVDAKGGYLLNGLPFESAFVQQSAITDLTDSTGGSTTTPDVLAAITAPTALTDNGGGTADGTVSAMADPANTPADADALRDDLVANFCLAVRNNFKEVTTAQGQNRAAIVLLINTVAKLAAKVNELNAALLAAGVTA